MRRVLCVGGPLHGKISATEGRQIAYEKSFADPCDPCGVTYQLAAYHVERFQWGGHEYAIATESPIGEHRPPKQLVCRAILETLCSGVVLTSEEVAA